MIQVRHSDEIYHKEGGWFAANWHFSFDEYYDSQNMGFGTLRVFNDDRLIAGAVWPMHPHRDVEGLTYVLEGTFEHRDSLGNGGVLPAGSVQRMTLGSGAWHSERNHSQTEPMRFIQMWIMPRQRGLPPSVEQKVFTPDDRTNVLLPVIAPDGAASVRVHQDAWVYVSRLEAGRSLAHDFALGFGAYFFLIDGEVTLNGEPLVTGEAARIWNEERLAIEARQPSSELIVVEVRV
ncbi:MAG TPA: pirin family protein [Dehalococcoidia bacterium]|nr:pirin family protein [Dehalococcoidia bacterium]